MRWSDWNLPPGCYNHHIEEAFGGDEEPPLSDEDIAEAREEQFMNNLQHLTGKQFQHFLHMLEKIGHSYPNDPGTTDLFDEQPVSVHNIDLGDIRLIWQIVRGL